MATAFLYAMPTICMMNNNQPYTGSSDVYNSSDNRDFAAAGYNANTDDSDGAQVNDQGAIVQSMFHKDSDEEANAKRKKRDKKTSENA